MHTIYRTVKGYGQAEQIIQKSRFIAYVNRAVTENEATDFIQTIKKKHWDATHNCSAYIVGENNDIQKANDDGEPSGTAGVPILEVIRKRNLKNTVIVITRYFGGIKLGAGGLIRAYGGSASLGLDETGIVECRLVHNMAIKIDYTLLGKVENELRHSDYMIKSIQYEDKVIIETYVPVELTEKYMDWITDLTSGQAEMEKREAVYLESAVES